MKVGIAQITSTNDLAANGLIAANLIRKAFTKGCEILFFPEASDYIAQNAEESVKIVQPIDKSPFISSIKSALTKSPMYVSVGIHEPAYSDTQQRSSVNATSETFRVKNTLVMLGPNGELVNRYQKIHLFDVPKLGLQESKSVQPGTTSPQLFTLNGFNFGPQICYDIRFPKTALYLRSQGANVLLYPSAFTKPTGEAHWSALNQARALDTQSYVLSAAQAGNHNDKRESYGHAIAIDPWGQVIAEAQPDQDLLEVELSLDKIDEVRTKMPLYEQDLASCF